MSKYKIIFSIFIVILFINSIVLANDFIITTDEKNPTNYNIQGFEIIQTGKTYSFNEKITIATSFKTDASFCKLGSVKYSFRLNAPNQQVYKTWDVISKYEKTANLILNNNVIITLPDKDTKYIGTWSLSGMVYCIDTKQSISPVNAYRFNLEDKYVECTKCQDCLQYKYNNPRCLNNKCFEGDKYGIYTTMCSSNLECPSTEKCINGFCTVTNIDNSCNPLPLKEDDIKTIVPDKFCNDNTKINMCSSNKPYYCNSDLKLLPSSSICGCNNGLFPDKNGNFCQEYQPCNDGDIIYTDCEDGTKVTSSKCVIGVWDSVRFKESCKVDNSKSFNEQIKYYALIISIILLPLIIYLIFNKKKR